MRRSPIAIKHRCNGAHQDAAQFCHIQALGGELHQTFLFQVLQLLQFLGEIARKINEISQFDGLIALVALAHEAHDDAFSDQVVSSEHQAFDHRELFSF